MQKRSKSMTVVVFIVFLASCTFAPVDGPPVAASEQPTLAAVTDAPATELPEGWGTVSIVNSTIYQDNWGDYMVVGMLYNGTGEAITDIKLTLRAADSAGVSVLEEYSSGDWVVVEQAEVSRYKSDTVPDVIPAGGYAPFATIINSGIPETYAIELTSYETSSTESIGVLVENAQVYNDGEGNYFIAGELVNTEAIPLKVEAITGAVLDNEGAVQAVGEAWAYGGYLLPAGNPSGLDRAPFSIQVFGPSRNYTDFGVYPLVVSEAPYEEVAYPAEVTHTFVDSLDRFHVVARVESGAQTQIASPEILAALYDENGLVIDVNKLYCFPSLNPGETGFVDVYRFQALDAMPNLAGRVQVVKVQVNPESIYTVSHSNRLEIRNVTREYQDFGPSWYFTGSVVNTTAAPIDNASVMALVYDADGTLVGADFAYISLSDDLPSGGSEPFDDLYVTLDPALDPSTLTYELIAWED